MSPSTPLGPGREFDVIRDLLRHWGDRARGVGDDAAIIDVPAGERLVVSTDSSVEDRHFKRAWLTPREIGYRATAAALSDLAAMAASPLGIVLAIAVPESWRNDMGEIAEGIGEAASLVGAPIVGGDLTGGRELSIAVTVLGSAVAPLQRGGARIGDRICVTGTLGGPARAIAALAAGDVPDAQSRHRFAHPTPRIREAKWLADRGATAAIDVSDGIVADAGHIAAASGVTIGIDLEKIPCGAGVDCLAAAASGEEYEILLSIPAAAAIHDFESVFRLPITEVGRVLDGEAGGVTTFHNGRSVAPPRGYDHFS
jgi:thiamine-monophosphate kinase